MYDAAYLTRMCMCMQVYMQYMVHMQYMYMCMCMQVYDAAYLTRNLVASDFWDPRHYLPHVYNDLNAALLAQLYGAQHVMHSMCIHGNAHAQHVHAHHAPCACTPCTMCMHTMCMHMHTMHHVHAHHVHAHAHHALRRACRVLCVHCVCRVHARPPQVVHATYGSVCISINSSILCILIKRCNPMYPILQPCAYQARRCAVLTSATALAPR